MSNVGHYLEDFRRNSQRMPDGKAGLDCFFLGGQCFVFEGGGGGVLFFLVCKKIAFPQQAIFFHLEGGRGSKGLYLSFSLCFSLRLVALFDSWP